MPTQQNDNPWASEDGVRALAVMGWPAGLGQDIANEWRWHHWWISNEAATAILNHRAIEWLSKVHAWLTVRFKFDQWRVYNNSMDLAIFSKLLGESATLAEALIQAVLKGGTDAKQDTMDG